MYTGVYGVERHHIFHHGKKEKALSERLGFIAPLKPQMHPNGAGRTKEADGIDGELKRRCKAYYIEHYGTEEQFLEEFYFSASEAEEP
ncbi:hypothetical protein HMPREF0980_03566 [Dorea sp. D27]|nr:hypothetical protein HMPREF0980_03566 [Dorea sp. D27]